MNHSIDEGSPAQVSADKAGVDDTAMIADLDHDLIEDDELDRPHSPLSTTAQCPCNCPDKP